MIEADPSLLDGQPLARTLSLGHPAGMVMTVPGELLVCARARRMFTMVNATLLSKSFASIENQQS